MPYKYSYTTAFAPVRNTAVYLHIYQARMRLAIICYASIMSFQTRFECSFSSSSSSSSLSSSHPSASNPSPLMPKLARNPMNAIPPNKPNARASPLGLTLVARENIPPETKGPTARPAADRVWARPLSAPRIEWSPCAELVIWDCRI